VTRFEKPALGVSPSCLSRPHPPLAIAPPPPPNHLKIICINAPDGLGPEWVVVELQGVVHGRDSPTLDALPLVAKVGCAGRCPGSCVAHPGVVSGQPRRTAAHGPVTAQAGAWMDWSGGGGRAGRLGAGPVVV
jgi:hypothetical protein